MWPLPFDDGSRFDRRARPASSPDVQLTCQVIARILEDPRLDGEHITVEVQNRVVNLLGTVSSLYARVTAADLARSTPGVADICNRLELARCADFSDGLPDLWPDPFDELVAHWDDERPAPTPHRRVRARLLNAAAALATLAGAVLWIMLLPRFGGAGLILVLPCSAAGLVLFLLAARYQRAPGTGEPPSDQVSS